MAFEHRCIAVDFLRFPFNDLECYSVEVIDASAYLWLMGMYFVAIPCLASFAYWDWTQHKRRELPPWRSFLGIGSLAVTLLVWLGTAYLSYRLYAHLSADFFTLDWTLANILFGILAAIGSLALKGRPRVAAFAGAALVIIPWLFDFLRPA